MRILLMGNPNVGKSVLFSRLTGVHVIASNYPGTTVEFRKGFTRYLGQQIEVIDVPGVYTLESHSKADAVALAMLKEGDIVINVVDATNLERNLNVTLQLIERGTPVIVALNFWDETRHKGIEINTQELERFLGVPVVCTVGITGEGIKTLFERLKEARASSPDTLNEHQRWEKIGHIVENTQRLFHRHHTFRELIEEASVKPIIGLPLAAALMYLSFKVIRTIGEGLIGYVIEPLFMNYYLPVLKRLSGFLNPGSFLHATLIGRLINGEIDFAQSFGLLTTALFVPIAMVLPYIFAFYLVLGILEDTGYLPRLAVLLDNVMHRVGLHGYAIVPNLLGLGCNVPGILGTRILESRRERFIACTLISIGVPCAALQAMIFGLVGRYGFKFVVIIYATLFFVWLILGLALNRIIEGLSPPLLLEVPPYRVPPLGAMTKKLWMRMSAFFKEAVPVVLIGVFIVNILYYINVFEWLARICSPVVEKVLGLPKEAVIAIVIGFLRKDVAVGMLAALGLSVQQLVIGCVVLAMFFPCIATFTILIKELGIKDMLKITLIMIVSAVSVGGLLNLIFSF